MSQNQILTFAAVALIAGLWGYRRGMVAGTVQASRGPAIGGGIEWLTWQAQ